MTPDYIPWELALLVNVIIWPILGYFHYIRPGYEADKRKRDTNE